MLILHVWLSNGNFSSNIWQSITIDILEWVMTIIFLSKNHDRTKREVYIRIAQIDIENK